MFETHSVAFLLFLSLQSAGGLAPDLAGAGATLLATPAAADFRPPTPIESPSHGGCSQVCGGPCNVQGKQGLCFIPPDSVYGGVGLPPGTCTCMCYVVQQGWYPCAVVDQLD